MEAFPDKRDMDILRNSSGSCLTRNRVKSKSLAVLLLGPFLPLLALVSRHDSPTQRLHSIHGFLIQMLDSDASASAGATYLSCLRPFRNGPSIDRVPAQSETWISISGSGARLVSATQPGPCYLSIAPFPSCLETMDMSWFYATRQSVHDEGTIADSDCDTSCHNGTMRYDMQTQDEHTT